jgi:hypothetical protein
MNELHPKSARHRTMSRFSSSKGHDPDDEKRLAFPVKESVYADVRGAKNDRRTPFAPSIASIRGSSW